MAWKFNPFTNQLDLVQSMSVFLTGAPVSSVASGGDMIYRATTDANWALIGPGADGDFLRFSSGRPVAQSISSISSIANSTIVAAISAVDLTATAIQAGALIRRNTQNTQYEPLTAGTDGQFVRISSGKFVVEAISAISGVDVSTITAAVGSTVAYSSIDIISAVRITSSQIPGGMIYRGTEDTSWAYLSAGADGQGILWSSGKPVTGPVGNSTVAYSSIRDTYFISAVTPNSGALVSGGDIVFRDTPNAAWVTLGKGADGQIIDYSSGKPALTIKPDSSVAYSTVRDSISAVHISTSQIPGAIIFRSTPDTSWAYLSAGADGQGIGWSSGKPTVQTFKTTAVDITVTVSGGDMIFRDTANATWTTLDAGADGQVIIFSSNKPVVHTDPWLKSAIDLTTTRIPGGIIYRGTTDLDWLMLSAGTDGQVIGWSSGKPVRANDSAGGAGGIPQQMFKITVENPDAAEDITIGYTHKDIVVAEVQSVLIGTNGPNVGWRVFFGPNRDLSGTSFELAAFTLSGVSTGSNVASFCNATITTDQWLWLETTLICGTINEFHQTIIYSATS